MRENLSCGFDTCTTPTKQKTMYVGAVPCACPMPTDCCSHYVKYNINTRRIHRSAPTINDISPIFSLQRHITKGRHKVCPYDHHCDTMPFIALPRQSSLCLDCHPFAQRKGNVQALVIPFCSCRNIKKRSYNDNHSPNACPISLIKSSTSSIPTDNRISDDVIPKRSRVSIGTLPCVMPTG
jgi:hypothetical protein